MWAPEPRPVSPVRFVVDWEVSVWVSEEREGPGQPGGGSLNGLRHGPKCMDMNILLRNEPSLRAHGSKHGFGMSLHC